MLKKFKFNFKGSTLLFDKKERSFRHVKGRIKHPVISVIPHLLRQRNQWGPTLTFGAIVWSGALMTVGSIHCGCQVPICSPIFSLM